MEPKTYFTYTCPVSRKTYDGHPRNGYLYTHDNDLEEAILPQASDVLQAILEVARY
jgi:hypothetical protein